MTPFILLAALLILVPANQAQAQSVRSDEGLYVRQQIGVSSYLGDNERSPFNFNMDAYDFRSKLPFSLGAEVGYQFVPEFNAGVAYQLADYPVLFQTGDAISPYEQVNTLRHTAALVGRYTVQADEWRIAPYLQGGFNASYSSEDRLDNQWTYGPTAGLGLDLALTGRTSLTAEWTSHFSLNDNAADAQDTDEFGNFDLLNALTLGVKHNFQSPFVGVDVVDLEGPMELEVGEEGLFNANANVERATTPLDFTWRFGDGTTASGLVAAHTFSEPGTYTVTFTAENPRSEDTETMEVRVVPEPVPAMVGDIDVFPAEPDTRTAVEFTADVMGDEPLTYQWSFGDGTTSASANPSHTYTEPGSYTVTLNVSNEASADVASRTLDVAVFEPAFCATLSDLNTAYFDQNASTLTAEAEAELAENANVLAQCASVDVTVTGMVAPNERGGTELARDRAQAVADFYSARGVASERIETQAEDAPMQTTMKVDGSQYRRAITTPER